MVLSFPTTGATLPLPPSPHSWPPLKNCGDVIIAAITSAHYPICFPFDEMGEGRKQPLVALVEPFVPLVSRAKSSIGVFWGYWEQRPGQIHVYQVDGTCLLGATSSSGGQPCTEERCLQEHKQSQHVTNGQWCPQRVSTHGIWLTYPLPLPLTCWYGWLFFVLAPKCLWVLKKEECVYVTGFVNLNLIFGIYYSNHSAAKSTYIYTPKFLSLACPPSPHKRK